MRKIIPAIAATAAFVPFMAQAEGLSYTYAEAGWLQSDINEFDEDLGGWGLKRLVGDHRQLLRVRPLCRPEDGHLGR